MRKQLSLLLALAFVAITPSLTTSCTTPHTAEEIAFKSMQVTFDTVEAARHDFAERYKAKKVSEATYQKALVIDGKFRQSFDEALNLFGQNWSVNAPDKVRLVADELLAILTIIVE